jgi:membrane dipeptidase
MSQVDDVSVSDGIAARASALHARAHVLDLICPWIDYPTAPRDRRYAMIDRMAAAGYTFVSLTIALDDPNVERVMRSLVRHRAWVLSQPDRYVLALTTAEIERAKREGKLAIGFHFQGTEPLQRNLDLIEVYYALGIRSMLIAYNQKNSAGDGCHESDDSGLTPYGHALVREMQRVGMLVDLSHTGYRTARDVLEMGGGPMIFSHSNPSTLWAHPRNIPDELASACAATGGVVGLNGCGAFLGHNDTSTATLIRHVDYYVQTLGPAHVGIGLDYVYDQASWHPHILSTSVGIYLEQADYLAEEEIRYVTPEQMPELTEGLMRLGYSDEAILGILGGNWLRVMRAVHG